MQQSWKSPRQISACRSALNLYGLAGRHELERIAHRFADDLERLGADQDQIALGDRCRLRAPDIDTDGRQHVRLSPNSDIRSGDLPMIRTATPAPTPPAFHSASSPILGSAKSASMAEAKSVHHGSFARNEALSRARPVDCPRRLRPPQPRRRSEGWRS